MVFTRILPSSALQPFVESYWMVQDESTVKKQQKIIPDGFTEVIFHLGDLYRINISGAWTKQSRSLLAGQIKKHFFLENTGRSEMIGIKFHPPALHSLFGISMHTLTDQVVDITGLGAWGEEWKRMILNCPAEERIIQVENFLLQKAAHARPFPKAIDKSLSEIFSSHGMRTVFELAELAGVSERYLEQLFSTHVGLSPKFYSRIIRFSRIFQLIQEENPVWSDLVYGAGYYDQSHFIRNFKSFTGEDPGRYRFFKKDLANFFMKKSD